MSLKTKIAGLAACLQFDNRIQLILDRVVFRKSRFVAHRLNGVQFIADQIGGDECGLRPCLIEGMYTPFIKATGLLQSKQPLNVADVGANAGGFSLIFATQKIPIRKIAAVEMNPLTAARMRLNLLTNFGPKAVPINAAIGSRSMYIDVPFTFGGTGDHINSNLPPLGGDAFSVPMLTLDDFLDHEFSGQKIDLLKMDIEGAEWDVLNSPACNRLRDCQYLIIEVHTRGSRGLTEFQNAVMPFGLELREVRNFRAEDVFLFAQNSINC